VIVELRQYLLRPGQRDVLIDLFDREFVESQEELGMSVLGQFRDLDRPDRFVWLRGFPGMRSRREALAAFYGGPVWKEHGPAANATMIDSDDVLLLRTPELEVEERAGPRSDLEILIFYRDRPWPTDLALDGALATLTTEYSENTFPRLPVREGEHVLVALTGPGFTVPDLDDVVTTDHLRLAPTQRSAIRGR
jgi:hypothetical protein